MRLYIVMCVIVALSAGIALATDYQYEHAYDAPAGACKSWTTRQCMELSQGLGVSDESCYWGQPNKHGWTVQQCLQVNSELRDLIRRRLNGQPSLNAPPVPQALLDNYNKSQQLSPQQLNLATPAPVTDRSNQNTDCINAPNSITVCVALPSAEQLDQPAQ